MERSVVEVHPQSLRALAYVVQQQIYGGRPTDDSVIGVRLIEELLIEQFGLIVAKDDADGIRLNQKPGSHRLSRSIVNLTAPENFLLLSPRQQLRRCVATLGTYLNWKGKPYIVSVSVGSTQFVPAPSVGSLPSVSERTGLGSYYPEGDLLHVFLSHRVAAVTQVLVSGVLANPFGSDVNDPLRWAVAMPATQAQRALITERAEIRLKGGAVATFQRKDQTNNGSENAINKP